MSFVRRLFVCEMVFILAGWKGRNVCFLYFFVWEDAFLTYQIILHSYQHVSISNLPIIPCPSRSLLSQGHPHYYRLQSYLLNLSNLLRKWRPPVGNFQFFSTIGRASGFLSSFKNFASVWQIQSFQRNSEIKIGTQKKSKSAKHLYTFRQTLKKIYKMKTVSRWWNYKCPISLLETWHNK